MSFLDGSYTWSHHTCEISDAKTSIVTLFALITGRYFVYTTKMLRIYGAPNTGAKNQIIVEDNGSYGTSLTALQLRISINVIYN
jgi:hypothetical protein